MGQGLLRSRGKAFGMPSRTDPVCASRARTEPPRELRAGRFSCWLSETIAEMRSPLRDCPMARLASLGILVARRPPRTGEGRKEQAVFHRIKGHPTARLVVATVTSAALLALSVAQVFAGYRPP
jgi:hypothetical protein